MTVDLLGAISLTGDSARVSFERHYDTDAADLWNAVTDPARLARWFAEVTGELREGGTFVIHFDDANNPECRVESCSAPTSFTWIWPQRGMDSRVEVSVLPDGVGSRLVLVHSSLTKASVAGYAAGWQAYVQQLDSHIDGTAAQDWWSAWQQLRDAYAATTATLPS